MVFRFDFNFDFAFFDHAIADAAIFYPAGQTRGFGGIEFIFDGQQGFF